MSVLEMRFKLFTVIAVAVAGQFHRGLLELRSAITQQLQQQHRSAPLVCGSVRTVVGRVGHTVTLPCTYDVAALGISNVCWGRDQSLFSCEYTLITTEGLSVNFRKSHRYSLSRQVHMGDVSLTIKQAQSEDTGFYICRVEIPGLFNDISLSVYLIIINGLQLFNITTFTTVTPTAAETQTPVYEGLHQINIFTEKNVSPTSAEIQTQGLHLFSTVTDTNVSPTAAEMKEQDFTGKPRLGSVTQLLHTEDNMETFILTTVRAGAVIFIPGLIIALVWKLRRKYGNSSVQENRHQLNIVFHSNMPVETPQEEAYDISFV
ncbi:hepatitis A virus cellular receptor 1 homolog [Trichomycterus rosablanca]|uniref:hepatitis A virus cellular receptor 1 homolog n=1 Tax=Trichomycterus rosablanca TaxID=2290929 RepID=UPI002F35A09C